MLYCFKIIDSYLNIDRMGSIRYCNDCLTFWDPHLLFRQVLSHPVLGAAAVQVLKRSTVLSDTSAAFQKPSPKTQRDSTLGKIRTTWENRSTFFLNGSPWGKIIKGLNRKLRGIRCGEYVSSVFTNQEMIIIVFNVFQVECNKKCCKTILLLFIWLLSQNEQKSNIESSLQWIYQMLTTLSSIH